MNEPQPDLDLDSAKPLSRRERKKERTRREIYDAALRLFGDRGYNGVTVEQICDAADVARGTFFAHFPTKSALLFEFNRTMTAEFERRLCGTRPGAVAELRALCALLAEAWLGRADVMTAMLREFLSTPASFAEAEREVHFLPELIEEIVARGQNRGELRSGIEPRLAAAVFLSTSLAILTGGVFDLAKAAPDEIRAQFMDVLLHGLVTSAGAEQHTPTPSRERTTGA